MKLALIATIGGHLVALDAAELDSVVDLWQVVPVPLAADHIIGLAAVRSRVLTVVDAAAAVGLRAKATGNRAIVVAVAGHHYALRVDSIAEVVVPSSALLPVDNSVAFNWRGVASAMIDTPHGYALVIDPAALVAVPTAVAA